MCKRPGNPGSPHPDTPGRGPADQRRHSVDERRHPANQRRYPANERRHPANPRSDPGNPRREVFMNTQRSLRIVRTVTFVLAKVHVAMLLSLPAPAGFLLYTHRSDTMCCRMYLAGLPIIICAAVSDAAARRLAEQHLGRGYARRAEQGSCLQPEHLCWQCRSQGRQYL